MPAICIRRTLLCMAVTILLAALPEELTQSYADAVKQPEILAQVRSLSYLYLDHKG